jgi:hypothetical protein
VVRFWRHELSGFSGLPDAAARKTILRRPPKISAGQYGIQILDAIEAIKDVFKKISA